MKYLASVVLLLAVSSIAMARPNILFLFADDWGKYASAYAKVDGKDSINASFSTPHIDAVAKRGTLFKHAFVTAPSCTPCRSSLLSGQYFYRTGLGAILQGAIWDPSIPVFPLLLHDADYHIGETYKVWSPGRPRDAPFGGGEFGYEKGGSQFNGFSQGIERRLGQQQSLADAKQGMLSEVRRNFQAFLDAQPAGSPFCYWFGPTNVHRKWIKGSGHKYWGIDPDELQGRLPKFLPDVPEVRQDFADYLGEAMAFDAAVGVIMNMLRDSQQLQNTAVFISGDHGAPGFPRGKCNLYDFGVQVPLIVSMPGQRRGRIVDDFVNLMDLAPTFLELGKVSIPPVMTGRSLVPVLRSTKSGWVDATRNWVVTGRERHVATVREGNLPYPQRAIRTPKFLYIINFKPDRWPMGGPKAVTDMFTPPTEALENNTFITFGDLDASPTKAWIVEHRNDPQWKKYYDYAFAKRPREELYSISADPDQMHNLANVPAMAMVKESLREQLMQELKRTADPRVTGDGSIFDKHPYSSMPYQGYGNPN